MIPKPFEDSGAPRKTPTRAMGPRRFNDLIAWQKAMDLVEEVYTITKGFPKEETYGLATQLRRASVSVPSNIAEGHSRSGGREFAHCLSIAHGSLSEVGTQLEIARRLGYVTYEELVRACDLSAETGRIINGLLNSLGKNAKAL
jgi:four helix bundle protein